MQTNHSRKIWTETECELAEQFSYGTIPGQRRRHAN